MSPVDRVEQQIRHVCSRGVLMGLVVNDDADDGEVAEFCRRVDR